MSVFTSSEEQLSSPDDDPNDHEFDTWITELLDAFDHLINDAERKSPTRSVTHYLQHSIPGLSDMMSDITCYSSTLVSENMLLDIGATRTICSENWLRKANWIPLKKIALGPGTKPFSFAGHPVQPLYAALLAARVRDVRGHIFFLKICAHILPPTPIPFLLGLVDQRSLGFDICLRKANATYLTINDKKLDTTSRSSCHHTCGYASHLSTSCHLRIPIGLMQLIALLDNTRICNLRLKPYS